jgi:two-component system, cell cycle sensor histidine kinase and response regulator CckA
MMRPESALRYGSFALQSSSAQCDRRLCESKILLFFLTRFVGLCAYLFVVFYSEAEKTVIRQLNDKQQIHAKQAAHGIEDFFATWTGILSSF